MTSLLSTAKKLLTERATWIYNDRRFELETCEYSDHYSDLGKLIARIEEFKSFSLIIRDIENEEFGSIGLTGCDDDLANFLEEVSAAV